MLSASYLFWIIGIGEIIGGVISAIFDSWIIGIINILFGLMIIGVAVALEKDGLKFEQMKTILMHMKHDTNRLENKISNVSGKDLYYSASNPEIDSICKLVISNGAFVNVMCLKNGQLCSSTESKLLLTKIKIGQEVKLISNIKEKNILFKKGDIGTIEDMDANFIHVKFKNKEQSDVYVHYYDLEVND